METEKNTKIVDSGKVGSTSKVISKRMTREQVQKNMEEEYEKDHEVFEGRFRYIEKPGQKIEFRLKKYARDGYPHYSLQDGNVYSLPRFVIDHINNEINYKKYRDLKGIKGTDGSIMTAMQYEKNGHVTSSENMHEISKIPRCEFLPLGFLHGEKVAMLPNKIVQVVER